MSQKTKTGQLNPIFCLLAACLVCAGLLPAQPADSVRVTVDEVKDSRTTGQFFAGMEIKLKLMSDSLDGATQIKAQVSRASDDTGRDLIEEEKQSDSFSDIYNPRGGQLETTLKLRNPARRASVVKELVGEIQVYAPKADPSAVVTVAQFLAKAGAPIDAPALKAAGIAITPMTREQTQANKAEEEKPAKEKAGKEGMAGAMSQAFQGMFSGFMGSENALTLKIVDPNSKIVGIEFVNASGKVVRPQMRQTTGESRLYDFASKLPNDTALRILLATPKAMVKVPFKLSDIPLP